MSEPVCKTCNDTHRMTRSREGDNDQTVMCTYCPTPCEGCQSRSPGRGSGPYCSKTPCACSCHSKDKKMDKFRIDHSQVMFAKSAQQAAQRWVQDHIGEYIGQHQDGDGDNVNRTVTATVFVRNESDANDQGSSLVVKVNYSFKFETISPKS